MKAPQSTKQRIWKTAMVLITLPVIALAPAYIIASLLTSPSQDTTDNVADHQATSQNNDESDFDIIKLSTTGTNIEVDVVNFGSRTPANPDSPSVQQPHITLDENIGTLQVTISDTADIPTHSIPFSDDECTLTLKTHDQRGFENRYTGSVRVMDTETEPPTSIIGYTNCRIYLSQ